MTAPIAPQFRLASEAMPQYKSRSNRNIALGAIKMATSYTALVDVIASDISAGRMKAGERLPPQRQFAFEKGIAASTAARVYAELLRRGLVVGEVGRGTFVAGQATTPPLQAEPFDGRIDLEFNFPTLLDQAALMARSLANWQQGETLGAALAPVTQRRLADAGRVSAGFFASKH